ncbi:hypothetical protein ENBRE01_0104 [Enteropsectra breve]|nr:hypothetical protein ENBRE01_0104 [Enteropsectra breve]
MDAKFKILHAIFIAGLMLGVGIIVCGFSPRRCGRNFINPPRYHCPERRNSSSSDELESIINVESEMNNFDDSIPSDGCNNTDGVSSKNVDQTSIMARHCEKCKKPMHEKLFPVSFVLEKMMGVSLFPSEKQDFILTDLHAIVSSNEVSYHRDCFVKTSYENSMNRNFGMLLFEGLSGRNPSSLNDEGMVLIFEHLTKSTKSYEFAYIYKQLQKSKTDIFLLLESNNPDISSIEKLRENIEKCKFKGREYLLAGLECYLLENEMILEQDFSIETAMCSYLKYFLVDSMEYKIDTWITFAHTSRCEEIMRKSIFTIAESLNKDERKRNRTFFEEILYCFIDRCGSLNAKKFIFSCMLSKHYYILFWIKTPSEKHNLSPAQLKAFKTRIPKPFELLSTVESIFRSSTAHPFLSGSIDDKARAIAQCIGFKSLGLKGSDLIMCLIYIKRMYKFTEARGNGNQQLGYRNVKEYLNFCKSIILYLLENMNFIVEAKHPILKICMFYNRRNKHKMHQSLFLAHLIRNLDLSPQSKRMNNGSFYSHLSKEEFDEMLLLRALNCNNCVIFEKRDVSLYEQADLSLANVLVTNGRLLKLEALELVTQFCKKFVSLEEYRQFLHDICFSRQLPECTLDENILDDLYDRSRGYERAETGFLPLLPKFYTLLNCKNWSEEEVLNWCEKVNFLDFLQEKIDTRCGDSPFHFVKRHFKILLKYLLDKTADLTCVKKQAELVVACWKNVYYDDYECAIKIFEKLASVRNGYYHANIFFLMNRNELGSALAGQVLKKIGDSKHSTESSVLETQKKYVKFIRTWEETDLVLTSDSDELIEVVDAVVDKLARIKDTQLDGIFADFVMHASSLNEFSKNQNAFYKKMIESLDFIPQAAVDLYAQ